jgi:hypothetical protein
MAEKHMKARFLATLGGIVLSVALGCGTASAATALSTEATLQQVYCQTPQFSSYVKFTTPSRPTPGGGLVCYDGTGTATIDLASVTRFSAGAHSGSFQYRQRPGLPIIYRPFSSGQQQDFTSAVEVTSLTINS